MSAEIFSRMPEGDYRERPEVSQSQLKRFLKSPLHGKFEMDRPSKPPTKAMQMGTCLHALVLEGKKAFVVAPEINSRTNAGKAELAAFQAENAGKIVLDAESADIISGMFDAVMAHPGARALIEASTERELSIFWGGMKCRIDGITPIGIYDLKTTVDASPEEFAKSCFTYGYHIQNCHYVAGAREAGSSCDDFTFICVENSAPFAVALYSMDYESLAAGYHAYERCKKAYFDGVRTGIWPGFSNEIQTLRLPPWAIKNMMKE